MKKHGIFNKIWTFKDSNETIINPKNTKKKLNEKN
jgi:hypothetical protein